SLHLGLDGIGLMMTLLALVVGLFAVGAAWSPAPGRPGFFFLNLTAALSGAIGVFLAIDLFLFAFFWELMLVPMYFLIGVWGHEGSRRAALKFFLFTQAGGLMMILSIAALALLHREASGRLTFDAAELLAAPPAAALQWWPMLGFFAAFAVKLPAFPLHPWLPDAHTQAPTAGSVVLAGLLLKTGAYGLMRFAVPLFPDASAALAPAAAWLGAAGVVYGALLAFGQTDFKRMAAYTSVSHLGFVLLGIYAGTEIALHGALLGMVSHAFATGGLFVLAGLLQDRLHTRELSRLGGLWDPAPRLGAAGLTLAMAALGLPGLGTFVAEFLVLAGSAAAHPGATAAAAVGLVLSTLYALRLLESLLFGPQRPGPSRGLDLDARETALLAGIVLLLVWLGVAPQPLIDLAAPAVAGLAGAR
ncbi:MAG TPA: NADH-quinone oxidoreductase subunit M, partial [Candidatus Polarisedimenticolia bacterium]|nr:NADH-quinone oxidoreductase subunit M [Candidatus Polarisedimenticolia bacterium]